MVTKFNLHLLGWHDFQQLCHTVIGTLWGQTAMLFADRNDGGRDGAFYGQWAETVEHNLSGQFVVQAKHTSKCDTMLTMSAIEDEISKASRLAGQGRCDIYVLMTNAGISGHLQEKLEERMRAVGVKHTLVYGAEWFNLKIRHNAELRMLVPRLYGLGDLTQILDERAYRQASAVLNYMRTDLAKLVRTNAYHRAARAIGDQGFVLLLGPPMVGKTALAAQLAISAADMHNTHVMMLDDAALVEHRWNPDERQFFWLDDAFGATQLNRQRALAWQAASSRVKAAIQQGCKFVLTSREYVYRAAEPLLKVGTFPLLEASQVVVDVSDLTGIERQQILYNHLKHGNQKPPFLKSVQPHLDRIAAHQGFAPELARRLSEPIFTARMGAPTQTALDRFIQSPSEMLEEILSGLDSDSVAALGLIFIHHGWLKSPVSVDDQGGELLERLGASIAGVIKALHRMEGALVVSTARDGESGWGFAHPTMSDAYARHLKDREYLHLVLGSFSLDVLLDSTSCGIAGIENAVVIPESLWPVVMDKLHDDVDERGSWWANRRRYSYIAHNCVAQFQSAYLQRFPDVLSDLCEPGSSLEFNPKNEWVVELHRNRVLPEDVRASFASGLIDLCKRCVDFSALWSPELRTVLNEEERDVLTRWLEDEVVNRPTDIAHEFLSDFDEGDPVDYGAPLDQLADYLKEDSPDIAGAERAASEIRDELSYWIDEIRAETEREPDFDYDKQFTPDYRSPEANPLQRSIFDDLI